MSAFSPSSSDATRRQSGRPLRALDGLPVDTPYLMANLTTVAKMKHIHLPIDLDRLFTVLATPGTRPLSTSAVSCDASLSLTIERIKLSQGVDRAREFTFIERSGSGHANASAPDGPEASARRGIGVKSTRTKARTQPNKQQQRSSERDEQDYVSQTIKQPPKCVRKHFGNQLTIVGHVQYSCVEASQHGDNATIERLVNIKLFTNGSLQITGVHTFAQVEGIPHALLVILMMTDATSVLLSPAKALSQPATADNVGDSGLCAGGNNSGTPRDDATCIVADARVCMINATFSLGFEMDRRGFFQYLRSTRPMLRSSFDPCVHAAVRIHFFHNEEERCCIDGVCVCANFFIRSDHPHPPCDGRGSGRGPRKCKKITSLVFQSGKCSITGGQTKAQVDAAYAFLHHITDEFHSRSAIDSYT